MLNDSYEAYFFFVFNSSFWICSDTYEYTDKHSWVHSIDIRTLIHKNFTAVPKDSFQWTCHCYLMLIHSWIHSYKFLSILLCCCFLKVLRNLLDTTLMNTLTNTRECIQKVIMSTFIHKHFTAGPNDSFAPTCKYSSVYWAHSSNIHEYTHLCCSKMQQ